MTRSSAFHALHSPSAIEGGEGVAQFARQAGSLRARNLESMFTDHSFENHHAEKPHLSAFGGHPPHAFGAVEGGSSTSREYFGAVP